MRKVLSAVALFVFCCTMAFARPASDARGNARRIAWSAATQPSLLQRIHKRVTGWIRTLEDPPPDPPPPVEYPERSHSPVPN